MLAMLIFGTCNTIVMKWQDKTEVQKAGLPVAYFSHPYF